MEACVWVCMGSLVGIFGFGLVRGRVGLGKVIFCNADIIELHKLKYSKLELVLGRTSLSISNRDNSLFLSFLSNG